MRIPGLAAVKKAAEAVGRLGTTPEAEAQGQQDAFAASQGGGEGSLFTRLDPYLYAPVPLPREPAPALERPVLFLHGLTGCPAQFQGMIDWLEREGANKSGGALQADHLDGLDPQANLFALQFSKPWNPIDVNVGEIRAAVEAICKATGATSVDLVCHSKGGLDARAYLMDPDERADHVVTVGSPHRGSFTADMEVQLRQRLGSHSVPGLGDPDLAQTERELSVDRLDEQGQPTNPALHALNAEWPTQLERADFLLITGNGVPTPTGFPGLTLKGDGLVERGSATLPDAPVRHLWGSDHMRLLRDPRVMTATAEFLIGD